MVGVVFGVTIVILIGGAPGILIGITLGVLIEKGIGVALRVPPELTVGVPLHCIIVSSQVVPEGQQLSPQGTSSEVQFVLQPTEFPFRVQDPSLGQQILP